MPCHEGRRTLYVILTALDEMERHGRDLGSSEVKQSNLVRKNDHLGSRIDKLEGNGHISDEMTRSPSLREVLQLLTALLIFPLHNLYSLIYLYFIFLVRLLKGIVAYN